VEFRKRGGQSSTWEEVCEQSTRGREAVRPVGTSQDAVRLLALDDAG